MATVIETYKKLRVTIPGFVPIDSVTITEEEYEEESETDSEGEDIEEGILREVREERNASAV